MTDHDLLLSRHYVKLIRVYTVGLVLGMIVSLYHREWLFVGAFFVVWFFLSVIGWDVDKPSERMRQKSGNDDAYIVASACAKAMFLFFSVIFIVMIARGSHWYFALLVSFVSGFAANVIPLGLLAWLVGAKKRKAERQPL
jgi:hypothetical protein